MAYRVVMENSGGELDSRPAKDSTDAAQVLAQMVAECEDLYDGDIFRIIDEDES